MEAEAIMTNHGQRWGQFVGPLRKAPSVCKVCVFIDGAWQLLVTVHVSLLREPGLYVYSTQPGGQFLLAQASMPYIEWHWTTLSFSANPMGS